MTLNKLSILLIKIVFTWGILTSFSTAWADGQANAVCSALANSGVIKANQQQVLTQAWQTFLFQLNPRYKKGIHSLQEIASAKNLSIETKLQIYAEYEKILYAAISADSSNPVSPQSIEKRAAEIVQLLIASVQAESGFTDAQKKQIDEKLSAAKVLTLDSLSDEPESFLKSAEIANYFNFCGDDLSALNASVTLIPNGKGKWETAFMICPKIASLSVPVQDKMTGIDFVLAHELSHLITRSLSPSNRQPLELDESLLVAQNDYLDCIQSQEGKRLRSLSQVTDSLRPNDLGELLRSSEVQTFSDAYKLKIQFEKYDHKDPTSIQSHESELLADRWASRVISPLVNETNAGSYLALFCEDLDNEDEGVHPTNRFRLENFLNRSCDGHEATLSKTINF
jgi:hypothetical protein